MKHPIILISAMSTERVIGQGAGMPWSVQEEYAQYLDFISDQTVIMGRKSYEIFGADLTSAHNLVLSRSLSPAPGYTVWNDLETALSHAQTLGKKIFVAGGARVYTQAEPLADEMYLSIIHGSFTGDSYFPEFSLDDWEIALERKEAAFTFRQYQRPA